MRSRFVVRVSTALVALVGFHATASDEFKPFVYVELGFPPSMDQSIQNEMMVADVNDAGEVVGSFPVNSTRWAGFHCQLDDDVTWNEYPDPSGQESTAATAINAGGTFLVWMGPKPPSNGGNYDTEVWSGPTTLLDVIEGGIGLDISDEGNIIGNDQTGGAGWICNGQTCLGAGLPGVNPIARAVENGSPAHIAGRAFDSQAELDRAALWQVVNNTPSSPIPLPTLTEDHAIAVDTTDPDANGQAFAVGYTRDGSGNPIDGHYWFPQGGSNWGREAMSNLKLPLRMNNALEVVGEANGGQGEPRLWHRELPQSLAPGGTALDLTELVAGLPDGLVSIEATAINDDGWIAGTAVRPLDGVGPNEHVICLLIPYDVDNNGVPDFREIISESVNNADGDWLIDEYDSEDLRPGLHAPGLDGTATGMGTGALEIPNTQAARLILDIKSIHSIVNNLPPIGLIDNCPCNVCPCQDAHGHLREWGRGLPDGQAQKEVILTIQIELDKDEYGITEPGRFSYIPPYNTPNYPGELTQVDILEDLFKLGTMFTCCIDYVQFYNEAFTGRELYITDPNFCTSGATGPLRTIPGTCLPDVSDAFFTWLDDCREALQRGSGGRNRPTRIIGPAFTIGLIQSASLGDPDECLNSEIEAQPCINNRNSFLVREAVNHANARGNIVDLHLHYIDPTVDFVDAIQDLLAAPFSQWPEPDERTCLEWGPKPSDTWWNDAGPNFFGMKIVREFYFPTGESCVTVPPDNWNIYLEDKWEDVQFAQTGFAIQGGFATLEANEFYHACYGPTNQAAGTCLSVDRFDLAPLRASAIDGEWILASRLTELYQRYQNATGALGLINPLMTPHVAPCNALCPSCP